MLLDPTNQYITTIQSHCDIRGKDVLEIGCGKGRITRDLAKYARRVVAVDPDAGAIDYARTTIDANNILFMQAPKGVPDSSIGNFNIVIYTLSLHHVPETEMAKSLLSAAALLSNDGAIVVIEPGDGGSFTEAKVRFGAGSGDERSAREAAIRSMRAMDGWTMGETIAFRTQFRFDDDEDFLSNMLPNYLQQHESFIHDVRQFLQQQRTADCITLEADRRLTVLRPSKNVITHE